MFIFNFDLETNFDPQTKIWSGAKQQNYYDRNCSIGQIIFEEMRRRPNKICQISDTENTNTTNTEALLQAIRIAKFFNSIGLSQTDIVGLVDRNTTHMMDVVLACFFTGIAFHAINPKHDDATSKQLFNITKPKIIFCDGQDYDKMLRVSEDFETKLITLKNHLHNVQNILSIVNQTLPEELNFRPAELEFGPNQTLAILCSSGSTGLPKAVTIPNTMKAYDFTNYLTENDIQFTPSTMDWLSGLLNLVTSLVYGTLRIISDKPYSPEYFLEVVEKYKVTFTIQAPSNMAMLLNCPDLSVEKLESIRYFLFGGGKCSTQIQAKLQSYLKQGKLCCAYGFTELTDVLTRNFNFFNKPNSVGRILPGLKVKIVNDEGVLLSHNEVGEIYCTHDKIWQGYYKNVKATMALRDTEGWFHSGDIGYFDEDNYLYIVDRKKDILKYRGMQYFPNEIEEVIRAMPEVVEVCVCGLWNDLDGDAAAAAVMPVVGSNLTVQHVLDYVRNNIQADYKQLHGGVIILTDLPKTATGKANKLAVKDILQNRLNFNMKSSPSIDINRPNTVFRS
ncbi:luciferin 4-monooxygenase-like [Teleopsis dalmanni]|uniref:luciferin 4-monooxygenase-like n=1 Tax=Teleopsis dalmanni TaxID=139649 RepID=UPI0018CF1CC0|nr:luciferin 4-monooxygenase-like [Teleopsis dalmanni]